MSIFPATDLVLDVGRAADPSKRDAALNRLQRLSGEASADKFTTNLPSSSRLVSGAVARHSQNISQNTSTQTHSGASAAYKKFEAFILQSWLETLLPKMEGGAYGHDNAGGVWRSMIAEQLGEQLAKSDSLGIARILGSGKLSDVNATQNQSTDSAKVGET